VWAFVCGEHVLDNRAKKNKQSHCTSFDSCLAQDEYLKKRKKKKKKKRNFIVYKNKKELNQIQNTR